MGRMHYLMNERFLYLAVDNSLKEERLTSHLDSHYEVAALSDLIDCRTKILIIFTYIQLLRVLYVHA